MTDQFPGGSLPAPGSGSGSRFITPAAAPVALSAARFAQNDDLPSSIAWRRVAWAYNHVSMHRRKQVFVVSNAPQSTPAPSGTSVTNHYFCFRTGENIESIEMLIGMAPAASAAGSNPAVCKLILYDGSTSISSPAVSYPKVASGTYVPSDVFWGTAKISTADGLLPNTLYRGTIRQSFFARIHSATVYESANVVGIASENGVCDPLRYETNKPVFYSGAQDCAETGTLLRKHNGAQLISFSQRDSATAPVITSTTYVNLFSTATVYGANNPGYVLNTQYHGTRKRGVPLELALYVSPVVSGGTLSIKLVDSAGDVLEETAVVAPAGGLPFDLSTHTITAKSANKTDILVKVSSGSWKIHSIGIWEYEA